MKMMKVLARIEIVVAAAFVLVACAFVPGLTGGHCTTAPCTYFANGRPEPGVCGAKKADAKHCYCFAKSDSKLSEVQSGCTVASVPPKKGNKTKGQSDTSGNAGA